MTKRVSSVGPTRGHSGRSRNSLAMIQSGNRILCINYKMPFLSIFETPTKNMLNIYIYMYISFRNHLKREISCIANAWRVSNVKK